MTTAAKLRLPSLVLALACFAALAVRADAPRAAPTGKAGNLVVADRKAIVKALVAEHGEPQRARIERGVDQVAALWTPADGDLAAFARDHFVSDPKLLDATFERLQQAMDTLDGYFLEIGRDLGRAVDLDLGPLLPVDPLLDAYDASAHVTEDLFKSKIAFVVLLNFPVSTLEQRLRDGGTWTRRQWAEARLAGRFDRRVPAAVVQEIVRVSSAAELYISEYNIWMHHVVNERGERPFPKGKRLISHWNLRDELKAAYADPKAGPERQRLIVKVMERIVTQTIPAAVIDNPRVDWNPVTNEIKAAPPETIEADAPKATNRAVGGREPDTRFAHLLALFHAVRKMDPYSPTAPTGLARAFESGEMTEARVVELLTEVLESPMVPKVAARIATRLGRPLEPQDLWYNGFAPRGTVDEAKLDALTRKRYPTPAAFAKDMPRILVALGFPAARAKLIASRIVVDPSRGAGHALEAAHRGDSAHLRTRIEKDGMNYKGYNIAVHELGHNVEQVVSLYDVDYTLLRGVPITAITEALAFVFQARDLELLGLGGKPKADEHAMAALDHFWATWEIAGVALVEIKTWQWLYAHPKATAAELREASNAIARDLWNRYYAPHLGGKDSTILGIYSHTLSTPLYLFNYPLGHLIAIQLEEHFAKVGRKKLGLEFERMCKTGLVTPDLWMIAATKAPVGTESLLAATERALAATEPKKPPR